MSLYESFNAADTTQMLAWQENLETKIRVSRFLKAIDERKEVDEAAKAFTQLNLLTGDDVAAVWINLAKAIEVK